MVSSNAILYINVLEGSPCSKSSWYIRLIFSDCFVFSSFCVIVILSICEFIFPYFTTLNVCHTSFLLQTWVLNWYDPPLTDWKIYSISMLWREIDISLELAPYCKAESYWLREIWCWVLKWDDLSCIFLALRWVVFDDLNTWLNLSGS